MEMSWIAVIVAAVVKFLIGWGWYSPMVFGKQWQMLAKTTPEAMQAGLMPALIVEGIGDLIMAFVLARIIIHYGVADIVSGVRIGITVWVGFVATVMANQIFYERKPQQLVFINAGYILVALAVMGGILGAWH